MTHNFDYLPDTTFRFYLIYFQLNADFPFQDALFTVKTPSITQRPVFPENAKKKKKKKQKPVGFFFFFCKTVGSKNYFTLIKKNFRFLR